jgi:molecular chaperone DnaJ
LNININFSEAALGVKKEIKHIDDKTLIIDIPKGIEHNTVLKVKSKGFKRLNQNLYGDLLITIKIITPKKLSKTAEELFKKLKEEL